MNELNTKPSISVIIPTLNAEAHMPALLERLSYQSVKPDEIIVIDSASKDNTAALCEQRGAVVICINREEFDHGGTRNIGINAAKGDIILFLTQDALPVDIRYIEHITAPLLADPLTAAVCGRQIAYGRSTLREKLIRGFNYKNKSFVRGAGDVKRLGIKAFFISNCCAAYRKEAIKKIGLFDEPIIIGEDIVAAARLINAGGKIAYAAQAAVYHSHDYTLKQQYKRNFDIGVCMAQYAELFKGINIQGEGAALARYVLKKLLKKGRICAALYFCLDCAVRYKAHTDGKNYKRFNKRRLLARTMNKGYWIKA